MTTKTLDTWEKFWPIRDTVRQHSESGGDCPEDIQKQWSEMRNHFVAMYYYIVLDTAKAMHKKITEVWEEQLASMGVDGLYDAIDGYGAVNPATGKWEGIDPKTGKKVKFETYAGYRIKGAILDSIRREDWVPRLVRSRAKKLQRKREEMESRLGRAPTNEEMAADLKLTLVEYEELLEAYSLKTVQSLNTTFNSNPNGDGNNDEMSMMDCIHDQQTPEPLDQMVADELKSKLFGKNFTPLERRIIYSYYYEGRSMKEIAEQVNLSESRVSQMNSAIIQRLRDIIRRNPEYFGPKIMAMIKNRKEMAAKSRTDKAVERE